ncbi:acyl-CoA dehydrogenase [Sphingomonas oryzagri]|uniref:Acyl-CoA dehydrogenase n=1 Tax=Sphingomonas oryzagri TaxID=3042314 RepID=A0ABT6MYM3_9SPHN|nr:acyl-CoA dehydrogenase [Sphingomonas oryzagri]MDH7638155.1 acyl-CoA dehydrogenase [Sphingomonas oryzagri]
MSSKPDHVTDSAGGIAEALAVLGQRFDASPRYPTESLRIVISSGLHRVFAPVGAGGRRFETEQARYAAMKDGLRIVGRGDLSVGRLFEGHVNALLLFGWYGSEEQISWLGKMLDRGAWFGVWATEPQPGVSITGGEEGMLSGSKMFASGSGGLDYALITAAAPGADRRVVIVPANDGDRSDTSGWRVRGMRASVSGTYSLDGIRAEPQMLLGAPGDYDLDPRFAAGAWRFCAVQLGGIEALLAETRQAMPQAARGDPVQRARFAEALTATRTAGFWVAEAARRAAAEHADAVSISKLTRSVVEDAGFKVMEAAARIVGTRSAFDGERMDKIIRDLSLYLRQAGPDHARDGAATAFIEADRWDAEDRLW